MAPVRPSTIDQDLVKIAKEELKHNPSNDNYYKMISGLDYDPNEPGLLRDRIISSERAAEYQSLKLRDFDSFESYVDARSEYVTSMFGSTGKNIYIEPPFFVDYGYNIRVGQNFYTNFNATFLDCSLITIGDNVMFGPNVTVTTASHPLESKPRASGVEYAQPITIGHNVWIGANVVILPGVTIGDDAVVAAGAVVSRDVEASTLVGGIPARFMKKIVQTE